MSNQIFLQAFQDEFLSESISFLVWSGLVLNVVKRGGGLGLVSLQSVAGHTVHHLKSSLGVLAGT